MLTGNIDVQDIMKAFGEELTRYLGDTGMSINDAKIEVINDIEHGKTWIEVEARIKCDRLPQDKCVKFYLDANQCEIGGRGYIDYMAHLVAGVLMGEKRRVS